MNNLSFTITHSQDGATTQASDHSGVGWTSRLLCMIVTIHPRLTKRKRVKIGPISGPRDGRPLNSDTLHKGVPIRLNAISQQDINVDTPPRLAHRLRRPRLNLVDFDDFDDFCRESNAKTSGEKTLEETINKVHDRLRGGDDIVIQDEERERIRTIRTLRRNEWKLVVDKFPKAKLQSMGSGEEKRTEAVQRLAGRLRRIWSGRKKTDAIGGQQRNADLERGLPESYEMSETRTRTSDAFPRPIPRSSTSKYPEDTLFVVNEGHNGRDQAFDVKELRAREEREKETDVERRCCEAVFCGLGVSDDDDQPSSPRLPISGGKGKQPEMSNEEDNCEVTSRPSKSPGTSAQLTEPPSTLERAENFRKLRFLDFVVT